MWVRLSPDEAAVVGEAAARAGMSVGAWVGDRGRPGPRGSSGDEPGEAGGVGPSSRRELVAALVALRAEVAALRRLVTEPAARQVSCSTTSPPAIPGRRRDGVAGVLRRIDAVTAAAVDAASSPAWRSSGVGRERPGRS